MYDLPFDLMVRRATADIADAVTPPPPPPPLPAAPGAPPGAPPGMGGPPPGMPQGVPPQGVPPGMSPGASPGMPPQIMAMLQARQGQPQPAMLPRGGLPPQIMAMLQARQGQQPAPRGFGEGGSVTRDLPQYVLDKANEILSPSGFAVHGGWHADNAQRQASMYGNIGRSFELPGGGEFSVRGAVNKEYGQKPTYEGKLGVRYDADKLYNLFR